MECSSVTKYIGSAAVAHVLACVVVLEPGSVIINIAIVLQHVPSDRLTCFLCGLGDAVCSGSIFVCASVWPVFFAGCFAKLFLHHNFTHTASTLPQRVQLHTYRFLKVLHLAASSVKQTKTAAAPPVAQQPSNGSGSTKAPNTTHRITMEGTPPKELCSIKP